MIDFLIRESTKPALTAWLKLAPHDFLDANGRPREGVSVSMWGEGTADEGRMVTQNRIEDANGDVLTPAVFLPGRVAIVRFSGARFMDDTLQPDSADPQRGEQWARSKFMRWIRQNGTPGVIGPITYYEIDGGRIYRPQDVFDWLAANNLPGHEYAGGGRP